jgi:integrase
LPNPAFYGVTISVSDFRPEIVTPMEVAPMAKTTRELTDLEVKNAKPEDKTKYLFDGKGLFLLIAPKKLRPDGKAQPASKWWRFKYMFDGKSKTLSFGTYPDISLSEARERRQEARNKLANGVDPGEIRKAQKEEQAADKLTFEIVARDWYAKNERVWSQSHCNTIMRRLVRDIFPVIGNRPIAEIKRSEIVALLKSIDAKGITETADRIKIYCGQIFRYALNNDWIDSNPATDLKDIISKRIENNHAAITDPKEAASLLRAIDAYQGTFAVKCALQLAPMFFVRPGELQKAEWSEIDLETAEWNIPVERMKLSKLEKMKRKGEFHLVPLSRQAIAILQELHKLTGAGQYLFPSLRSNKRPMSNIAMLSALRRMGFTSDEMTTHGFRAMARTILDEVLHVRPDFIEHQLAHAVKDPNGRAYNRTAHLAERRKMMQLWADYLDTIKSGSSSLSA